MTVAVRESLDAVSDCLDSVRGMLGGLDDKAVIQTLRDIEVLARKTQSVMLGVVAEIDSRGIAGREGFGPTQRLLAGMPQLSAAEARMRVEHAAMVGPRRAITGEVLPPRLPDTAAALAEGQLGTGQLRVITGSSRRAAARPSLLPARPTHPSPQQSQVLLQSQELPRWDYGPVFEVGEVVV